MKLVLGYTVVLVMSAGLIGLAFVASGCMAPTPASHASGQSSAPPPVTATPSTLPTPTATAATISTVYRAQVDFGKPVGDAYLRTLLDKHQAKMVVAYMTTSGFFGADKGIVGRVRLFGAGDHHVDRVVAEAPNRVAKGRES